MTTLVGIYEYSTIVCGAKSNLTCANYALLSTGMDKRDSHPIFTEVIKLRFYMGLYARTVATVEEAVRVYKDVRTTLQLRGAIGWSGFALMKWSPEAVQRKTGKKPETKR